MATNSMHKPGWRSRRRSRLSLVERAVPRLGRVAKPEDAPKPVKPGDDLSASSTAADVTVRAEPEPPAKPESSLESSPEFSKVNLETKTEAPEAVSDLPSDQTENQPIETSDEDVTPSPSTSERPTETPATPIDTHASMDTPDPVTLEDGRIETAIDPAIDIQHADTEGDTEPEAAPAELSTDTERSTSTEKPEDETEPTAVPPASVAPPPSVAALAASQPCAPKGATDLKIAPIAPEPGKPASSTGATLNLDWDHLIASGFTDPRQQDQPLTRNMDPIIRALLRQALSDQSSWRDRIILVTSPNTRFGKSAAAINFAFGLTTINNHHAVLVDVDSTGRGAVDHLCGHDRIGITDVLSDDNLKVDDLVVSTDLDRLTLVASGAPDPDLVDHLASRRMLQILRQLIDTPDTILVIDAPPILVSQEAAVLSVIAGQVVLAVEAGETTADQIEHALQRLGERHNVSLVLSESSGIDREDRPSAFSTSQSKRTNRRARNTKRHLPKAATAAAGALAIGLFVQQFQAEAAPDPRFDAADVKASAQVVIKPERWSNIAGMTLVPCHQMCR